MSPTDVVDANSQAIVVVAEGYTGSQGPQGPQGVQGIQGPQGSGPQGTQGVQGIQGPQGVQGPQGGAGPQGNQGTQGPGVGSQGPQGAQGATGSQGAQGSTGTTGSQGTTGAQGTQGAPGAQGATGPQGATGAQGPQGTQGVQGTQGATGSQGAGTQGAQGAQGAQGPTAASPAVFQVHAAVTLPVASAGTFAAIGFGGAGADFDTLGGWVSGSSIYRPNIAGYYWVQVSYIGNYDQDSGTIVEINPGKNGNAIVGSYPLGYGRVEAVGGFASKLTAGALIYLNGTTDYVGMFGNSTDSGSSQAGSAAIQVFAVGSIGAQGPQGSGSTGAQGPQGPQGAAGTSGATGSQGPQGTQGAQGTQGPGVGAQGPQGTTGPQGAQGSGVQGAQGAPGAQGATGPQGPQGTAGASSYSAGQGITISGSTIELAGTESVNVVATSGSSKTLAAPATDIGNDYTLSANCTFAMPTATRGGFCYAIVRQPASGGTYTYTATFTGVKWPGGTAPTMSTGVSAVDRYDFISDGTSWYGVISGQAFA
jgi:hypothetical protein